MKSVEAKSTPEMVDGAWLLTRPQFYWHANLDDVQAKPGRSRLFWNWLIRAARELSGKPADTLTVFQSALFPRSSEIGSMKDVLNDSKARNGETRCSCPRNG